MSRQHDYRIFFVKIGTRPETRLDTVLRRVLPTLAGVDPKLWSMLLLLLHFIITAIA